MMDKLFLKGAIILLTHSVKKSLANPNQYLKPKYTEEGKFILDHLSKNDVLEAEQKDLPNSLHTVFKLEGVDTMQSQEDTSDNFTKIMKTEISSMTSSSIQTVEILKK